MAARKSTGRLIMKRRPTDRVFGLVGFVLLVMAPSFASAQGAGASIIPEDRRMDWRPCIPGGIPAYSVFSSVKTPPYGAKGDGKADDTAAIQKALDDCPEGKAVLLPEGTYRLTATLKISKGIVLRGEGPAKTRLINEATAGHSISLCNFDNEIVLDLLKGSEKGSTSLTVSDASRLRAGDLLLVDQVNDPDLVEIQGEGGLCRWAGREDGKRAMGQLVELVRRAGNTLTISRPLAITFKESLAPQVVRTSDKAIRREAQNLLYLGDFQLAAGRKEEARAAFKAVLEKHARSSSAPAARERLDTLK